jgi:hypothetical protein
MIPRPRGALPPWRRGFPFFLAKPRSAVERLRSATASQIWREGPLWKRLALGGIMTVTWPLVTLVDSAKAAATRARRTDDRFLASFTEIYYAALTRNIPPAQFARYIAVSSDRARGLSDFLLPLDLRGLQRLSHRRGAALEDAQNKARFEQICAAHGLPCIPTLATFLEGASTGEEKLRSWTQPFFVKALTANRGAGAERWIPRGAGFVAADGLERSIDVIIDGLRAQNCIVQPLLEDCAELQALGSVALSSMRVVTVAGETTRPTVVAAALNLPNWPNAVISNHGALCGIDVKRGIITTVHAPRDEPDQSPATGQADYVGFVIPFWRETLNLVRRAHAEAFPKFVSLGWDIALTAVGPILIETNLSWGVSQHQLLTGPLGKTRLADVIEELLSVPLTDRHT